MATQIFNLNIPVLLEWINPDKNCITCVGNTRVGARCRNPINLSNRVCAATVGAGMNRMNLNDNQTLRTVCHELAGYLLCVRNHQNQVDEVVERWITEIRRRVPATPAPDPVQVEMQNLRRQVGSLQQQMLQTRGLLTGAEAALDRLRLDHQRESDEAVAAHETVLRNERRDLLQQRQAIEAAAQGEMQRSRHQVDSLQQQMLETRGLLTGTEAALDRLRLDHQRERDEAAAAHETVLRNERQTLQQQNRQAIEQAREQWLAEQQESLRQDRARERSDYEQRLTEEAAARKERQRQDDLDRTARSRDEERDREQRMREELDARERRLYEEEQAREQRLSEELRDREERLRVDQTAARLRALRRQQEEMELSRLRQQLLQEEEAAAALRQQRLRFLWYGAMLRAQEEAREHEAVASCQLEDAIKAEEEADIRERAASAQRAQAVQRRAAAEQAEQEARDARTRADDLTRQYTDLNDQETSPSYVSREYLKREQEDLEHQRLEQQDWAATWTRYERDWTNILRVNRQALDESVCDSLPWPVRSGNWQDVNEQNVEDFFVHLQTCGRPRGRAWFPRMLRRQVLRWQEENIIRQFPRAANDEEVLRMARLVAEVVRRLRDALLYS